MRNFFYSDPKLLLYGFTIIFFASYGQTFFISIFNNEIRTLYNLTDGEFGFLYALSTLSSALILVVFAKLIDWIDLKLYSLIISVGLAIACFSMYINYNSIVVLFFIIFGLRFFGQGAMSHAGETTMARYFDTNRGKAISIATLGGQIGIMFFPIIAISLLNLVSWNMVWMGASFTVLFIYLPLMFVFLQNQKKRHLNFKKSNEFANSIKRLKTRELLFDKKFYIYLPISITTPFIGTGLVFHQIFIINEKVWTLDMLANGFILLGVFSIIGLFFGGPIIDKFNTKKVVIYTLAPLFLAILVLIFFDSYIAMFVYLSLFGLNMGISSPFVGSLWAELYGLESLGTVKALLHASAVFASAISPLVFGYIIDLGMGINTISMISLCIIFISTLPTIIYQNVNE